MRSLLCKPQGGKIFALPSQGRRRDPGFPASYINRLWDCLIEKKAKLNAVLPDCKDTTDLPPCPCNLIADDYLPCTRRLRYGLFPFLGLLAFAPVLVVFLFAPVLTFVLPRPALLLPRLALLALAVLVLELEGGTTTVTLALVTVMLALAVRLALPFPLFAFSGVQATLETRSVNTARAKIFLIIISFKAAASLGRRNREESRQKYIPYSSAKVIALCKRPPNILPGYDCGTLVVKCLLRFAQSSITRGTP